MAGTSRTAGAASSSGSYATVAAHELRRQRSMPAAAFARCGSGARARRRSVRRLGDDGESRGVGAVARALWAWVARRRRKALSRSGSSSAGKKERHYGHEEYAQNFDEGAAAAEPENLSRSFSARFAGRRLAGQAPWDGRAR